LRFTVKKVAQPLLKLLKSAVASAKNLELEELNLYISKILVDEGPKLKRWRARARGSADEIQKKTSHVTIVLDEIVKKPRKVKKVKPRAIKEEEVKEKVVKPEKPKPKPEIEIAKPKIEKGVKRVFRRKAF
jgi:large subunit ribosomal protein L22